MNRQELILLCTTLVALAALAPAQKIPLEGDRIVQLHDVGDMIRAPVAASSPADVEEYERIQLESMAEFVRTFMQPPLDGDADVRPLGRSHLVALARPEQLAWLENLIRTQREVGDYQILLEMQQLNLSDAQYEKVFQPLLRRLDVKPTGVQQPGSEIPLHSLFLDVEKTRTFAVLSKEDADGLMAAIARDEDVNLVQGSPRLLSYPMMHASMGFYRTIKYVKDFDLVVTATGESVRVPVHDELFDGIRVSVMCGMVGIDLVGLTLSVEVSEAEVPIPTITTETEEGLELTVELPSLRVFRLEETVVLPNGGTGLFAVQRNSGNHTVFLVTVATRN